MYIKNIGRLLLCAFLAALFLLSAGCNNSSGSDGTSAVTSKETAAQTAAETEAATKPETDPAEETEEPTVMVKISDKLELPQINHPAELKSITADLNSILKNGYGSQSLQADAFASVFDKVILFKAGKDYDTAYILGKKTELEYPLIYAETGNYIALQTVADLIGGDHTVTGDSTSLVFGENSVSCTGGEGTLKIGAGEPETIEARTSKLYVSKTDSYADLHYINVKDAAKLTGLNVFCTDTGIVTFSCGQAFDPLRGYYIALEGEKLYLNDSELQKYSDNMFVDIPNVIKLTENNVAAYTFPELDINANVATYALQGVTPRVGLGPAIVAGQGPSADNYTVVRVFDIYQTLHTEFNAYPASVKGGVQVACAVTGSSFNILTAPFEGDTKILRVYDANGAFKFTVSPTSEAPYSIAAGSFCGGSDCFAVVSRNKPDDIEFFSAKDGSKLSSAKSPITGAAVSLSPDRTGEADEGLIVYTGTKAFEYKSGKSTEILLDGGTYNGVYASAFGGFAATMKATDEHLAFSEIAEINNGKTSVLNVGARENSFFSTMASKNTEYIKKGVFWHTRLEYGTAAMMRLTSSRTQTVRTNDISLFTVGVGGDERSKYKSQYNMWEPCGTHRWGKTASMGYLINYVDPDSGTYAYATLTKTGERNDYLELGASFYNGSYAPFIPALDRLNYWTRRTYLQELATLYRDAPEYTVAVSPVHEHEIDSGAKSVGDYNVKMIAGFADWLKQTFKTIENVNARFGTSFASFEELDAPRNDKRGDWDAYSKRKKTNDYFTWWSLYNRYIVSQRVIEAYREALLAGFPPELIKAHQIPEGDAVAGLLGEADTRISPVDIVLACGTGYGGTRYSVWYHTKNNFFALAANSGQHNITLGEYSSMTMNKEEAYDQLKYMYDNGIVFTHVMYWEGNASGGDSMDRNEKYAIDKLQENEYPRSASSGGTGDIRAYVNGDTKYNIIEIGAKDESAGLLKSVKADGTFEGTVYLQPFHAAVEAVDLASGVTAKGSGSLSYKITGKSTDTLNYNDTVDIRLTAKPTVARGSITVKVYQGEYEVPCVEYTFKVTGEQTEYRYVLKDQTYLENCRVEIEYERVDITDGSVTFLFELTARKYFGDLNPRAHTGGVSFDLLY